MSQCTKHERLSGGAEAVCPWCELQAERAKREEAERNYYTLCDAVCRESKGVEDACNQARAERTRSAALMAEVLEAALRVDLEVLQVEGLEERMLDIALTALRKLHARALIVLSQSPTEKKT